MGYTISRKFTTCCHALIKQNAILPGAIESCAVNAKLGGEKFSLAKSNRTSFCYISAKIFSGI